MLEILDVLTGERITVVCKKTKTGEVLEVKNNNVDLKTKNFFVSYPRECFSESDIMFITIKENVLLDKHSMVSFM